MKSAMKMTVLALAISVTLSGCWGRIETGNVGVRTDFNKKVEAEEVAPGWYGALFTSVDEQTVKEIEVVQDDMRPKAKDNLSLGDFDLSVFYSVNPSMVADLYTKYSGMTYYNRQGIGLPAYGLVDRQARSVAYDIVGKQFDSLSIHQKRTELEEAIRTKLQEDLEKSDPKVFTVTKVVVRQALTDPALEESIRASVRVQKEIEAKNQQITLAEAEAKRLFVEAKGAAQANEVIAASITPNLIKLREIEMTAKFAKEGTHTVLMQQGTGALVNVGK